MLSTNHVLAYIHMTRPMTSKYVSPIKGKGFAFMNGGAGVCGDIESMKAL
jgi:hypothetical protein